MLKDLRPDKYLKYLVHPLFGSQRTKEILSINPTIVPLREEAKEVTVLYMIIMRKVLKKKNWKM
jgi:magnesium transporter